MCLLKVNRNKLTGKWFTECVFWGKISTTLCCNLQVCQFWIVLKFTIDLWQHSDFGSVGLVYTSAAGLAVAVAVCVLVNSWFDGYCSSLCSDDEVVCADVGTRKRGSVDPIKYSSLGLLPFITVWTIDIILQWSIISMLWTKTNLELKTEKEMRWLAQLENML